MKDRSGRERSSMEATFFGLPAVTMSPCSRMAKVMTEHGKGSEASDPGNVVLACGLVEQVATGDVGSAG